MTIAPIVRSVYTKASPHRAFNIFTNSIGSWWPKGRGIGARPLASMVIEPFEGGRWYECDSEGEETQWGRVLTWAPPSLLMLAWQIDANMTYDPDLVTEVELVFEPAETGGTTVTLTHRNLERFGQNTEKLVESIGKGWSQMVDLFAQSADEE